MSTNNTTLRKNIIIKLSRHIINILKIYVIKSLLIPQNLK